MKKTRLMLATTAILVTLALLAGCGGTAATTTATTAATTTARTTTAATTTGASVTTSAMTSATTSAMTSATTTAATSAGITTGGAGATTTASGAGVTTATTRPGGTTAGTDMVATASIVDTPEAFEKAISKSGYWLIATLKDLNIPRPLLLEGDFPNGRKDAAGADVYQRKIGLYTQDANRVVTKRFTLTAPRLTINSRNPSLEHGTFVGDIYVAVPNFKLIGATVQGNVYFKTAEVKSSFTMDAASKITGTQEVRAF